MNSVGRRVWMTDIVVLRMTNDASPIDDRAYLRNLVECMHV